MLLAPAQAETLRIATFNTELSRKGPGLLLRDVLKGKDTQLLAVRRVVAAVDADILVLQNVDYDHDLVTLNALRDWLGQGGAAYPHIFARAPNSGLASGLDLDGDGRLGGPGDAQGYGDYFGKGGMAILSRHAFDEDAARDFSDTLWRGLPGALLPEVDGKPFPSEDAQAAQRLSSVAHWLVPIELETGLLHLMTFHAAPPVFDGPEDRNGKRNHDELTFWRHLLDGTYGPAPDTRFVLLGDANLDPIDGGGLKPAIHALLDDSRLQDPKPQRPKGEIEDSPGHAGDPRLDTVAWPAPDPGHLRVDYVLPSSDLEVVGSGVFWPAPGEALYDDARVASRHRVVWVDLQLE